METRHLQNISRGSGEPRTTVAGLQDLRPEVPRVELASQGGIDIIAAVSKRPFVTVGVVLACLLVGAQYLQRRVSREYHAEASVYVSPTYFKNVQQDREQLQVSYSTLVNQQILTIRRFDILHEALDRLQKQGIQWREPAESDEGAVARLAQQLEIQHIPDSYEVLIGLNGTVAERLAPIVNTITETYLERQKRDEMSDRSSRLAAFVSEQANVAVALQQKLDQQSGFSQKLTTLNLDKATTVDDALLTGARRALEDAHRKRVEAEAQFKILQTSKDSSNKNLLSTLAEELATSDPNARPVISGFLQRTFDLQKSTEGLKPEHPLRQAAEKEIFKLQDQLKTFQKGITDETSTRMLAKMQADVDRNHLLESELNQEVDEYTAKVQGVAKQVQLAQVVNEEIDRLRRQQNAINTQIDALNMPGDSAGYLRIFSAARTPLGTNKSNSSKLLIAVLGVALILGLATATGMDLLDQRIFAPSEVKRAVGFPPVGIVLERTPDAGAFSDEHFRRLVNGIQRGLSAQNSKSIVLTPLRHARVPDSLTADIGRMLSARGLKTAIVEANPRAGERTSKPVCYELPALPYPEPGSEKGDSRIPCNIEMKSSWEVGLTPLVSRISGLLADLEREYDVVLIDAPPLAFSADTEFLSSISDITLLVAEAGEATRRELIRSATILGRVGAPCTGVILSQVGLKKAGRTLKQEFRRFASLPWSKLPNVREV